MPAPPLSDELAAQAAEALRECNGDYTAAARKIGISVGAFRNRVMVAARRGLAGYAPKPAPPGYAIKGMSTYYSRGEPIGGWVKTDREEGARQAEWLIAIEEVCERIKGFAFLPPRPKETLADLLVVYPRPDLHIGLYAWGEETGEDWSVDIATQKLGEVAGRLVSSVEAAQTALVLGLGDLLHADDSKNRTPRSGAELDVDTRYARVMRMALGLEVAKVQLALQRHETVIYKALPGNHDPHAAVALSLAIGAFFHAEPRVTVDQCPKPRWYYEWGDVLIGATHGHTVKQTDLPLLMAADMPEAWGRSRCRRYYTGHLHHQSVKEHGGVVCEQFQSPAARDAYHAAGPWISGRGMTAITFHRTRGEIARSSYSLDLEAS